MPLISIVVPVYNCEDYLEECILSILNQSFFDWELLLIDDGSTDNSPNICDLYKDDDRVFVIHKSNQGVAIARKTGVDLASGKYITFVDSDDWLELCCLEKVVNIIKNYNPQIISFSYMLNYDNGISTTVPNKYKGLYSKRMIEEQIFPSLIHGLDASYYSPRIWGNIFETELIKPFMISHSKAKIGEDSACVIPAVYWTDTIYFMDEIMYHYRINSISATRSHKIFEWDNPRVTAEHISNNICLNHSDFDEQLYRRIAHDLFNVCITQFFRRESIFKTQKRIKENLNNPYYRNAINNAVFEGNIKADMMLFALKHNCILLMFLYSKIREIIN